MLKVYEGKIVSITLMSDKKEGELLITNAMKNHYHELAEEGLISKSEVILKEFDLKKHIKGGKTENINPFLLEELRDYFHSCGYFMI